MRPLHISSIKRFFGFCSAFILACCALGCGDKLPYMFRDTSLNDHDSHTDGDTDTDADTDTDTDTDVDTDVDTDTDTDVDTDSDTDSDTTSDEPWAWVDNPEGEDCGPGCVQLTFEDRVNEMEWDIWEYKLVYSDGWWRVFVVDIPSRKTLKIPDMYPAYPTTGDSTSKASERYPTIYQQTIFYTLSISAVPHIHELIRVDLNLQDQQAIWHREFYTSNEVTYFLPDDLDAFGDRLVTRSSTGDPQYRTLGYHEPPWPSAGEVIIDKTYGGGNSLWEDTLVFWELNGTREDITGYDFKSAALFAVTDDDEYQFRPRIHKRRVVYMDLRLGESATDGTWEHGAIFMKDLDSGEVTQITDGAAIASYPDIYDDIIVWMDWRNCPNPNNKNDLSAIEIWGYNLATDETFQITDLPEYQKGFPRIWKDKVYVQMFKDAKNGVYQFELPEEVK